VGELAHREVNRILDEHEGSPLSEETCHELIHLMETEARSWGMDHLPDRPQ
jgi:hypothetical protein